MNEVDYAKLFGCDEARIVSPTGRKFLILGTRRNTRNDESHWYKNGERVDFDYLAEKVVASGDTDEELLQSARNYKRLLDAKKSGGNVTAWKELLRQDGALPNA